MSERDSTATFHVNGIALREKHNGVIRGTEFGRLTVLGVMFRTHGPSGRPKRWSCVCECICGATIIATINNLQRGYQKSCGCKRGEFVAKHQTKHGLRDTKLYGVWESMKQRCHNPNSTIYEWYGGRGIEVCREWRDSFQAFHEWAMANGYEENLEIDRIENNGNYEPANCRFITHQANCNNRRPRSR